MYANILMKYISTFCYSTAYWSDIRNQISWVKLMPDQFPNLPSELQKGFWGDLWNTFTEFVSAVFSDRENIKFICEMDGSGATIGGGAGAAVTSVVAMIVVVTEDDK